MSFLGRQVIHECDVAGWQVHWLDWPDSTYHGMWFVSRKVEDEYHPAFGYVNADEYLHPDGSARESVVNPSGKYAGYMESKEDALAAIEAWRGRV